MKSTINSEYFVQKRKKESDPKSCETNYFPGTSNPQNTLFKHKIYQARSLTKFDEKYRKKV